MYKNKSTKFSCFFCWQFIIGLGLLSFFSANARPDKDAISERIPCRYIKQDEVISANQNLLIKSTFIVDTFIQGTVEDRKGIPLIGVSVRLKGFNLGTTTDGKGRFSLRIPTPGSKGKLVFSYIGYGRKEVAVNGKKYFKVIMEKNVSSLNQVLVIAYGTQKKKDVTGSIATINNDAISDIPVISFEQLLKGQVAGLQASTSSGTPGAASNIEIRGISSITASTQPLYVIDGVPVQGDPIQTGFSEARTSMDFLDPSDIQSIEVLKDASATAIYGARGANGVILITTKKGKVGNSTVTFTAATSINTMAHKIQMMTTRQNQEYWELAKQRDGKGHVQPALDPSRVGINTDWQDVITQTKPSQKYHLGFSGGQQKVRYNLSFNYSDQDGLFKYTNYKRYGMYGSVNIQVNKKLSISEMLTTTWSKNKGSFTGSAGGTANQTGAVRRMLLAPTYSVPNDSVPGVDEETGQIYVDPMTVLKDLHDDINATNIMERFTLKYNILPGLNFKSMTGITYRFFENDQYQGPGYAATKSDKRITAKVNKVNSANYINENTITYSKGIQGHHFTLLVGNTLQQKTTSGNTITAIGFPNANTGVNALQEGEDVTVSSNKRQWQLASFFGRLNYNYKNKYLLTATLRRDGSSKLSKGNKWGTFPSLGIGWNLSDERFFKNVNFISHLKLRASWGEIGNSDIGVYETLSTISSGTNGFDNQLLPYYVINRYGDPNLKWETTVQGNIGIDIELLNGQMAITADVYDKKTKDLLLNKPVPFSTGYGSYLTNVGSMRNRGFELSLDYKLIDHKAFSWSANFNFSTLNNEITSLAGQDTVGIGAKIDGKYPRYLIEGTSIGAFFLIKTAGVWQSGEALKAATYDAVPGDWKYIDQNHDGLIDNEDRVTLGNSIPQYTIGVSNTFRFEKLDLRILLTGDFGAQTLNTVAPNLWQARRNGGAAYDLEAWSRENPTNELAAPSIVYNNDFLSDAYLENADIVRIQNVKLGYRLNLKHHKKTSFYIYLSGNNLWSWSGYKGYDPEVGYGTNKGIDRFSYPKNRVYNLGIKMKF